MTHRVHPYIFRIGQTTNWKSRWFSLKNYKEYLREDTMLREWLSTKLRPMHVSEIEIERSPNTMNIIIRTARPGILIGRGGEGATKLKKEVERQMIKIWKRIPVERKKPVPKRELKITVEEIKSPFLNAAVVAQSMADELEKRMPFRRVLKQTLDKISSQKEVLGVRLAISGRLDGSEMARYEWLKSGRIPLQTIRADVDFSQKVAYTTYGTIGIKVWIYKGDVFAKEVQTEKR
ncbi:MAG: 30S ribosomal protein S3 [Candidatus Sungbacteria bacterium RIFCSPLOWO2_02_FULL_47_9]|uniref:Small ribosomal subunit protein uS3 n=2 Tax=root TaxID=1 RepID=A0A1G2K4L2_9BACT|nr:30S ribosomal protein S3 [uncultured organism]OGZ94369.1 MAG: 30S ribosomal protein S3 [Candidatus Sungbacteria bacterium RIFCSPHIGHO2_01_FULL_47_32]OGZ98347.1 MAG: 30S ribosomal protein S3 [Candidatus Sungbacteria bacterium RIFCSPHIGHO2_02_FULL_46_12]OHA04942.1 MAG: 30S ribosomal protein S3 [Candidatus Sungbacteria bacterium RIFCSPLOWO2_01_FULL_47_32]OHA12048.1 MAG: 30S ribosomal protein S3 [Candidatus Sungbacteria bacterium RIFCSPLOWO2_02_FULL_47_9]